MVAQLGARQRAVGVVEVLCIAAPQVAIGRGVGLRESIIGIVAVVVVEGVCLHRLVSHQLHIAT